jgi:hypothetical protein
LHRTFERKFVEKERIKNLNIPSPLDQLLSLIPVGDVTVLGKNLNIHLYDKAPVREVPKEVPVGSNDYIEFAANNYRCNLARSVNTKNKQILRLLTLFLAQIQVDRVSPSDTVTIPKLKHGDDDLTPIMNNSDLLNRHAYILAVPGALLEMESVQRVNPDEIVDTTVIKYNFTSKFPDAIKVTTNLSEYSFFRNLIGYYKSEVEQELKAYTHLSKQQQQSMLLQQINYEEEKKSMFKKGSILPSKVDRKFEGSVELNPKLNVLGDMTPKVETVLNWLGIKDRNVIPRATHSGLTDPLESLLIASYNLSVLMDKLFEEK